MSLNPAPRADPDPQHQQVLDRSSLSFFTEASRSVSKGGIELRSIVLVDDERESAHVGLSLAALSVGRFR